MNREHRYYVAKKKDVEKYLSDEQQLQFDRLLTKIRVGRLNDGKSDAQTVCVDSDWPEYEIVWKMIEARVDGKASPASVPAGQALWDSVYKMLRGYRVTMMVDSEGDGYPLIDAMSPEHGTVTSGIEECTYLADAIYNDLVAAAPTPPVSEDRWLPIETAPKYGRFLAVMPSGMMSVIVWLEASHPDADGEGWYEHWKFDPVDPTHWMPLPKAPTMQEDKP